MSHQCGCDIGSDIAHQCTSLRQCVSASCRDRRLVAPALPALLLLADLLLSVDLLLAAAAAAAAAAVGLTPHQFPASSRY